MHLCRVQHVNVQHVNTQRTNGVFLHLLFAVPLRPLH